MPYKKGRSLVAAVLMVSLLGGGPVFLPFPGVAAAGNAVLFADLPLNGQQRFQKSGSGGEIPLYFGFLLEGGILGEIAVPGVPAIVVADGGNVIHILLQKRGGF